MLIYPAIDLYGGKCVRLLKGDFDTRTVYSGSPPVVARRFVESGLSFLHVVDLEGAQEGRIVNWDSIRAILSGSGARVQVGGGIRTEDDIRRLLTAGASRVVVGSLAVLQPEVVAGWLAAFGPEAVAVALDVKDGSIAYKGWVEQSRFSPAALIERIGAHGAKVFICTDVSRDGMLSGPNVELYESLLKTYPDIELIASGGISSTGDIRAVRQAGCAGVIVGKAIYDEKIGLEELRDLQGA